MSSSSVLISTIFIVFSSITIVHCYDLTQLSGTSWIVRNSSNPLDIDNCPYVIINKGDYGKSHNVTIQIHQFNKNFNFTVNNTNSKNLTYNWTSLDKDRRGNLTILKGLLPHYLVVELKVNTEVTPLYMVWTQRYNLSSEYTKDIKRFWNTTMSAQKVLLYPVQNSFAACRNFIGNEKDQIFNSPYPKDKPKVVGAAKSGSTNSKRINYLSSLFTIAIFMFRNTKLE